MDEFSIVVQGRLNSCSLSRLQKYTKYGPVIYSYRDDDDTSILENYNCSGVTFVTYPKEILDTTFNCFNTYYQCNSTLQGLLKVQTKYVIKLRSDNFIGNLLPLMEAVLENPDKYVCTNIYFRPDIVQKFCPSDQIIAGRTDLLTKCFSLACYRMENHSKQLREGYNDSRQTSNLHYIYYDEMEGSKVANASAVMPRGVGVSPEVLIGTSWLAAKDIIPDPDKSKQQMKDHFFILDTHKLAPYLGKDGTSEVPRGGMEISNILDI